MPSPSSASGRATDLKFADVKRLAGEHLRTALNVLDFSITFARHDQQQGVWKVNVEFKERIGNIDWPTSALLAIDASSGEVREFKKGHTWAF